MKIKGTNWYTASAVHGERIEGSGRSKIQVLYGYRLPVQGQSDVEIKERIVALKEKGVLVRHFKDARICDYVRITMGKKEQMDVLLQCTKQIWEEQKCEA